MNDRDKIAEKIYEHMKTKGWTNGLACKHIADWILSCLPEKKDEEKMYASYDRLIANGYNTAIDQMKKNLEE